MKSFKLIALLLLLSISFIGIAQIEVYPKNEIYPSEILLNINKGKVNLGDSRMWSDAVLTVSGNQIFEGWSTSTFDLMYTFNDGKLSLQESSFSSDVKYTYINGKIYRGDSSMMMD